MDVVAHQLLVRAVAHRYNAAQEVDELHCVLPVTEEEVHALR